MREVLIIGAGAAGLAAAEKLVAAGLNVTLIEAQNRVGGRIHTIRDSGPTPLEAGPEFIHGEIAELETLIARTGTQTKELPEKHWQFVGRKPMEVDFGPAWESVLDRLPEKNDNDQSFASFLEQCCSGLPPEERTLVTEYVEGFNAADGEKISVEWLRKTEFEIGAGSEDAIRRVTSGYDRVAEALLLKAHGANLHLNSRVFEIRWQPGRVAVVTMEDRRQTDYSADCVIVTLPLGVLKTAPGDIAYVRFHPDLPDKRRAIDGLEMGAVIKVALRFRRAFWQERRVEAGFLRVPNSHFVTWWPFDEVPILTGWAGGPRAQRLSGATDEAIREIAIADIARGLAVQESEVRDLLVEEIVFNWQRDPWCLGAYSYASVGGSHASESLAVPVCNTIYFAGEATAGALAATVAGAILSGHRAADEVLQARESH